jgi:hypothetical protein
METILNIMTSIRFTIFQIGMHEEDFCIYKYHFLIINDTLLSQMGKQKIKLKFLLLLMLKKIQEKDLHHLQNICES